jgi:pimeloyl-ACP methyl ester carboxylesterase
MSDRSADQTFVSRFYLSDDGLKLHYREYAGPPSAPMTVLCIPGLTRNARDFEELAPHLAARYRVWCLELRGRGDSAYAKDPMTYTPATYVRDVATLFKATGLGRAAFIGTSLGGLVSTLFTALMPAKVLGVILNDIGPDIDAKGLARIAGYLGKSRPITTWDEAADAIRDLDGVIYPDYTRDDWMRMARRRFVQNAEGAFRPNYDLDISKPFAGAATPDLWPFFERLRDIPAMVIRGATSDLLAAETVERMRARVPTLAAVEVPNRGHTPNLDEPMALSAIDDFLAKLPRRVGPLTAARRTVGALTFLARLKRAGTI